MTETHWWGSLTIADSKPQARAVTIAGSRSMQVVWAVTTADWKRRMPVGTIAGSHSMQVARAATTAGWRLAAEARLQPKMKPARMLSVVRTRGHSSKGLAWGCSPARRPPSLDLARKGSQPVS